MISEEMILIWGRISQIIIVLMILLGCYVLLDDVREFVKRRREHEREN